MSVLNNDKKYSDQAYDAPQVAQDAPEVSDEKTHQPTMEPHQTDRRRRWSTMALLLALSTGLIIAAAVGGGLGALLANKNKEVATLQQDANTSVSPPASACAPPATTTTTATITKTSAVNIATPSSTCNYPSTGLDVTQSSTDLTYTLFCNADLAPGTPAQILFTRIAYTMQDCLDGCDNYNIYAKTDGRYSVLNATMANWNWVGDGGQTPGTCWCSSAASGYEIVASMVRQSGFLKGSFDEGSIPSR
ncbi:hypothetical protein LTR56_015131 [Elasticomyces elasticus]|nr:hypothetical protein LTR56_015131 [Elasticomyces elasticus]KAK3651973.1 hypothetical protein LTR22_011903 [Elasticomyces elasticus]KAK4919074.1 hypothetical protein LTR49_013245 [Elasticomyces elasticus]KAK5765694.1 hypothetical protein LTS12_004200 [Elasticomyces elasticus]